MGKKFGLVAFEYPMVPHSRSHGPGGYSDYQSFKPWLRDEFSFRCVYCLVRERWYPDGHSSFGVDHQLPQSVRPDLICDYDNLLYLCNRCNAIKQADVILDPCLSALGDHLRIEPDGVVVALSEEGEKIIDVLVLNHESAKRYRRRKIDSLTRWKESGDEWALVDHLGFPEDLPQLDTRRSSNSRPSGIARSHFERERRGELPSWY